MTKLAIAAEVLPALSLMPHYAAAQRAVGIDVSSYQGTINWATVAAPKASGGGGIEFAFIRATRGRASTTDTVPNADTRFSANIQSVR